MTQSEIFGSAEWIAATPENIVESPVFRKSFTANAGDRAKLRIIGLGTFEAFLNGERISDDLFMPLNSGYEKGCAPDGEELECRIWCVEYDVSRFLREGDNVLAVLVGDGWYDDIYYRATKTLGEKKLCFALELVSPEGETRRIESDESVKWSYSFTKRCDIHKFDEQDYRGWNEACLGLGYDDSAWEYARLSKPVESNYGFCDCPADKVSATFSPLLVSEKDGVRTYDAGVNISGYPVFVSAKGENTVTVRFSEELTPDGALDTFHAHKQYMSFITDREGILVYPRFTWFGFRYFTVEGDAEVKEIRMVYSDVDIDSSFDTDNKTLNWIYHTFLHTQLCNMHRGIPSDCPHIERMGYTGDGQACCRSVLHTLDAKEFYAKWIKDISDCQDRKSGHVQYTAPYARCGGGPGGWGSAIVVVPYEFWKYYGDDSFVRELYPQMLRYFDFLDAHSEYDLVTSDRAGEWCLGDWCAPPDQSNIPAPFVNTYFYVWAMQKVIEIAKAIGKEADVPALEERVAIRKKAINTMYFNDFARDATYCGGMAGANAFALNIGLGRQETIGKLVSYYDRIGYYDTGIFGTEIVTRKLFEIAESDLAFRLLTQDTPHGFGFWQKDGATTLREYWGKSRSHSHPMFGAIVSCLFEYILGIRQEKDSYGYEKIVISPALIEKLNRASGHITTPKGKIAVSYEKKDGKISYRIEIPEGATARLALIGRDEETVGAGAYEITVDLEEI